MAVEWSNWYQQLNTLPDIKAASPYVMWDLISTEEQGDAHVLTATRMSEGNYSALLAHYGNRIVLPSGVAPNAVQTVQNNSDMTLPQLDGKIPTDNMQKDDVIVAVIDDSIAPGHVRFRDKSGSTRVKWFWNMAAQFDQSVQEPDVTKPPFGQEYYWSQLCDKIDESNNDEWAVSKATQVIDFAAPDGPRGAALRASHGTHILDVAAGERVGDSDDLLDRMPILAVNLPNRTVRDTSGKYLEFYIINAIQRILDITDAMWQDRFPGETNGAGESGFRVVINISFGFTAGPKNGQQLLDRYIRSIKRERSGGILGDDQTTSVGQSIPQIFFPCGNDYLSRTAAQICVNPKPSCATDVQNEAVLVQNLENVETILWRVLPDDHTSSFMEIWFNDQSTEMPFPSVEIGLAPPGHPVQMGGPIAYGQTRDLVLNGQIIGRMTANQFPYHDVNGDVTDLVRPWIHIALAPTFNDIDPNRFVASGAWNLVVANSGSDPINLDLFIQRDDSIRVGRTGGRQSYFDCEGFDPYDKFGRLELSDCDPVIKKSGTINALACLPSDIGYVNVIGAFDKTTKRLAPYSSAGPGFLGGSNTGRVRFDYAAPGDESPVRSGILAAGSGSGGAAAWSGTSVACAIAAGSYARQLLTGNNVPGQVLLNRKGTEPTSEMAHHGEVEFVNLSGDFGAIYTISRN